MRPLSIVALALLFSAQASAVDFDQLDRAAQQLPRLHSLLISRGNDVLFEAYYNGRNRSQAANMKSASKSVISALIGIALEEGMIESLDQPIADFFPEYITEENRSKARITIEDLLTMESGLASTSDDRTYGRWAVSSDWVKFVLDQPMVATPGQRMIYSTGSTHLLSAILTRATGMDTRTFAQRYLLNPLKARITYWSQDPQGIYFGGNNMEMTPRDMLAFGQMYLDKGHFRGRQVISSDWVEASLEPHAASPRGQGRLYGYGWWLRELGGVRVPVAWGFGGQLILVIEELDLVVVATALQSTRRTDTFAAGR
jgi:CubicO group peptidase (beta-lactamase class C family)